MEFHDDLFPDTASDEPGVSATAWFSGANGQVMAEHKFCFTMVTLNKFKIRDQQSEMNLTIISEYLTFLQRKLVSLNPQRKTAIGSRRGLGLQPGEVKEAGGGTSADVPVTNKTQV